MGHLQRPDRVDSPGAVPGSREKREQAVMARGFVKCEAATRKAVIRECVTWLALNHSTYKPEHLAEWLARDVGKGEV